jgi:hypothetical protein
VCASLCGRTRLSAANTPQRKYCGCKALRAERRAHAYTPMQNARASERERNTLCFWLIQASPPAGMRGVSRQTTLHLLQKASQMLTWIHPEPASNASQHRYYCCLNVKSSKYDFSAYASIHAVNFGIRQAFQFQFVYFTNYNRLLTSMNTKMYSIYDKKGKNTIIK